MPSFAIPIAAVPAEIARPLRLQIVSPCAAPPAGDGWLHEIKHDGHRLLAIISGGDIKLISRNGHGRLEKLRAAGLPPPGLDGEIAVPDEKGITHIDRVSKALARRWPRRLAELKHSIGGSG